MCDCSNLPGKWWAENDESDREASSRGWRQEARVGAGWAVLWKCPACGQYWEGIVACSASSQDCIVRYYGSEEAWFNRNVENFELFVQEDRVRQQAEVLADDYRRHGYEVGYRPYRDIIFGTVDWMYEVVCRKRRTVKAFVLTLANNGGVCVRQEKD